VALFPRETNKMKLRQKIEQRLDAALHKFCLNHPDRVRVIHRRDKLKYLQRTYLIGNRKSKFCVFLHHFYSGDQDLDLHNHPWFFSGSLILTGGYKEEYFDKKGNVASRLFKSGNINLIRPNTYHRIDLLPELPPTWTLFFSLPRIQNWGFKNRHTKEYTPHEKYIGSNV
jgi:hypothetical protein